MSPTISPPPHGRSPMARRTVLQSLLAAPLLVGAAGSLTGCGRLAGVGPAQAYPVAKSTVTREPVDPRQGTLLGVRAATASLGGGLLRTLAPAPPRENLLISPYSIMMALTMAGLGAKGQTEQAFIAVLNGPPTSDGGPSAGEVSLRESLAVGCNALAQQLASYAGEVDWNGEKLQIVWSEANSLWGQNGTPWEQPFLDDIARYFGGGMHQVDYIRDSEAARVAINGWTKEATGGKIPEIIARGMLNDMTRLVLVNAVHFKAPWMSPFDKSRTTPAPFTRLDGSRVDVQMMRGKAAGVESGPGQPGFTAVQLNYEGLKFAFTAVLPAEGQEKAVHEFMVTGLGDIMAGLRGSQDQQPGPTSEVYPANLAMPRFSLDYSAALKEPLIELGLGPAFDSARADFSGMTTAERLFIAFVAHQATMDVDEEGTEASAATAVGAEAVSAPAKVLDVTLDRPFYVVLHDTETDTPLFLGYVADPTTP